MKESNMFIDKLSLIRLDNTFKATLCCCFFSYVTEYEEIIQHLHPQERNYYYTLKYEKRSSSYLLGRFVAKQAVAAITGEKYLTNICIQSGVFNQPIAVHNKQNIQVSITHCGGFGAALAFSEAHPMGIDVEQIKLNKRDVFEKQSTNLEKLELNSIPISYDMGLTLLWTVKEALSKVLKTGLTVPLNLFEISKIELSNYYIVSYYKNFTQYKAISFTIGNYMCSIVLPLKTKLSFNIQSLKSSFSFVESFNDVTLLNNFSK
ncbi:4'-phosphopantetheinyl transferase family protein [Clostridium formicaceticum]|nr:4'-phosphopantetheinyl transferase superfamily protein [Clostridium formicaceticum]AOY78329.1 4'-phosphopantetheinyl transferase [Clostridium formicaceticum]